VRPAGCHFNFARAVTFQPCADMTETHDRAETQHIEKPRDPNGNGCGALPRTSSGRRFAEIVRRYNPSLEYDIARLANDPKDALEMKTWLAVESRKNWDADRANGFRYLGISESRVKRAKQVKAGDNRIYLCERAAHFGRGHVNLAEL
jgi:hypothetical protein